MTIGYNCRAHMDNTLNSTTVSVLQKKSVTLSFCSCPKCPEYDPSGNLMQDFPLAFRIGSIPS